jgi:hypothetical protein
MTQAMRQAAREVGFAETTLAKAVPARMKSGIPVFVAEVSDGNVAVRDNCNVFSWLRFTRRADAPHWNGNLNYSEMAELIERFLEINEDYPQEWNDFVEVPQREKERDACRKRCDDLDPLVNNHEAPDPDAIAELRSMVRTLREKSNEPDLGSTAR